MDSNYFALRDSKANRDLHGILLALIQPSMDIEQWLDDHGEQCRCIFCAEGGCPCVLDIEAALNALDWSMGQVAALIAGATPGTPHDDEDPISRRIEGETP
jgi:hypothetical protein